MRIQTPAEACAALAVVIAGADEIGTHAEGRFLFDTVAALPMFSGLDQAQFRRLIADTAERVYSAFPMDGYHIADDGVGDLARMIRDALTPELRLEALEAAVGLARSDGLSGEEIVLLEQLCVELEIDDEAVTKLLGPAS